MRWAETLTEIAHILEELRVELAEIDAALITTRFNVATSERHERAWEYERAYDVSTKDLRVERARVDQEIHIYRDCHYIVRDYMTLGIPFTLRTNPMPVASPHGA